MGESAAMHYLVERIESDLLSANRNMAWRAAGTLIRGTPVLMPRAPDAGRPLVLHEADPEEIRRNAQGDIIRILDREGNVVWWHEHRWRDRGLKQHAEIMDDLMKLDPPAFRAKYRIIPERPLGSDAPQADPAAAASGSAADPNGPWADTWGGWTDRVARSEGGFGWQPSSDAGGRREDDVPWSDPKQH